MTEYPFWPRAYPATNPPPKTKWMQSGPISFVGGWEPLSFRQRAGFAFSDEKEFYYNHEYSNESLERIKALGCTHLIIPFTKGDGLSTIDTELDFYKDIIQRAHARDLRVGVYIRVDNIIPDTVRDDYPDIDQWLAIGTDNRIGTYEWSIQQTYRKLICYTHPSAVNWLENTIQSAIKNLGADLLHMDGTAINHIPWNSCRCERCTKCFRDWLHEQYGEQRLKDQFGLLQINHITIPEILSNQPLPEVLANSDMILWHLHLWDKQLAFSRHVCRFTKELNPDVAISANPSLFKHINILRWFLIDWKPILDWVDIMWSEDPFHLQYDRQRDLVISRIGENKRAHERQFVLGTYHKHRDIEETEKSLAFTVATNGLHPSCQGFSFRYLHNYNLAYESKRRFHEWLGPRWQTWAPTTPFGEIALLHHTNSLAWNAKHPMVTLYGFEQLLMQMKVAWREFDQITAELLTQTRTLILPDCECLSNDELLILKQWTRDGGNLLFTAISGMFDEYRRRRPRHPIFDWIKEWKQQYNDTIDARTWYDWKIKTNPQIIPFGCGRLGLWPGVACDFDGTFIPPPFEQYTNTFKPEDLAIPDQGDELTTFIKDLHGNLDLEVSAPGPIVLNVTQCANHPTTRLIHIVQTDPQRESADVKMQIKDQHKIEFKLTSPDMRQPDLIIGDQGVEVREINTYAVIECTRNHTPND
ncbi:MAG: hypothetical protein CMJ20_04915 [Phycisphaeraceae bacterium]|nr:hypothetical protein [Phycisphaeraceae bacterium]